MAIILHVDMDAFYAAVEERDDPSLRGRPVVVGGKPGGRGVVSTANYEARAYGLRSAMPTSQAARLCPEAVFVRPDFSRYKEASRAVMGVVARYADILEVVGMDEAYVDVSSRNWSEIASVCRSLQAAIQREVGISASIGAAPCKQVAKVASDWQKPHGVTLVAPDAVHDFLQRLPVGKLNGCGPKTAARLNELGFRTVGDLAGAGDDLRRTFGSQGAWLARMAVGDDPRPVVAQRGPSKSRGAERTFGKDVVDCTELQRKASQLLDDLLDGRRAFSTVTVKIRYRGFITLTRAVTFPAQLSPADPATREIVGAAVEAILSGLLDGRPVRLIGVRLSGFDECGQRSLAMFGLRANAHRPRRSTVPAPRSRQTVLARG